MTKERLQAWRDSQDLRNETIIYVVEEWHRRSNGDNELISYRLFKEKDKAIRYEEWLTKHNVLMNNNYTVRAIETHTQDNITLTTV